jgi:transcriptional regulator NrdR family protein
MTPLVCPHCGAHQSKVCDTGDPIVRQRAWRGWTGSGLWRLRECLICHARFTTEELVTGKYPQPPAPAS